MQSVLVGLIVLLLVWTAVITYLFLKLRSQLSIFTKDGQRESLPQILEGLAKDVEKSDQLLDELRKQYATIEKEGKLHIQKVGLLRFNPFKDTGGDQSFVLALVDAEDSGIIISGLYSRSGTRWYAKKVQNGKGIDHDLSDEEQKAVRLAKS